MLYKPFMLYDYPIVSGESLVDLMGQNLFANASLCGGVARPLHQSGTAETRVTHWQAAGAFFCGEGRLQKERMGFGYFEHHF